jgi:hypothetical protein
MCHRQTTAPLPCFVDSEQQPLSLVSTTAQFSCGKDSQTAFSCGEGNENDLSHYVQGGSFLMYHSDNSPFLMWQVENSSFRVEESGKQSLSHVVALHWLDTIGLGLDAHVK